MEWKAEQQTLIASAAESDDAVWLKNLIVFTLLTVHEWSGSFLIFAGFKVRCPDQPGKSETVSSPELVTRADICCAWRVLPLLDCDRPYNYDQTIN